MVGLGTYYPQIQGNTYIRLEKRLKETSINPDCLVAWATKFCMVLLKVCGFSSICTTWLYHPSGFKILVGNLCNHELKLVYHDHQLAPDIQKNKSVTKINSPKSESSKL
jgi:hypothetical protein